MDRRKISVLSLGGTIAMTADDGGLQPSRSASDLVRALGHSLPDFSVETSELVCKPSASLSLDDVAALAAAIDRHAASGAEGVVVTQGTDTLEETSFALECLATCSIPVVFTGAMRSSDMHGYEGGANLVDALRVADHLAGRAEVVVVMDGEVHAPRFVAKLHTSAGSAFASPGAGPLMRLHEGQVIEQLTLRGGRLRFAPCSAWPRVALLTATLGDDGRLAKLLPEAGFDGCVIAGVGGGHVPSVMVEPLATLALRMPVVLASRIGTGSVFEHTYGYPGSERDLLARGLISGGWLGALKTRILLILCLAIAGQEAAAQFARALKTLSSPPAA